MLHLRNLRSSEVFDGVAPWDFSDLSLVPLSCFSDKGVRDMWVNNPELQYNVYTLYEGVQSNRRLCGERPGEEGNPPDSISGFAVDYDVPLELPEVVEKLSRFGDKAPTWFEQTLSGHARLIWMFEKPVKLPSRRFARMLLQRLTEFLPVDRLPGIDKGSLEAPERYFTNGARWARISSKPLDFATVQGWVIKASEKFDWTSKEFGKAVSLEAIREECKRRFPRFSEWPGDFQLGSTGPSFWIEGSTSPKSAIVRETGIHTFSAHANKAFYSWAEIVGAEFVDTTENNSLGKAVEGIFYDGRQFIWKNPEGKYVFENRQNLELILRIRRGVSDRKPKGSHSELELAVAHIIENQRVDGAASCAFYPHGVFSFQGKSVLNTHQVEAMKPAADPTVWGPTGGFPFLSEFLDTFFDPVFPQKDIFLCWLQIFYRSCLHRVPRSGHGLFICGPVNAGKSFLNTGVIAGLIGGHALANDYLMGSDNFNSEMFDSGFWSLDDGTPLTSDAIHRLFSENVKKMVANRHHRVNEKFRKAVSVPWQGRIGVTCNDDPISIRTIPNLDLSIREKLLIFRAGQRKVQFKEQAEMEKILARELPNFARWLLDWAPPSHCFEGADVRFGCRSYCEDSLARAANRSSDISSFTEMLTLWLRNYWSVNREAEYWEGSATQLRLAMSTDPSYAEILRQYKPESMPRMLALMQQRQIFSMQIIDGENERLYRIFRAEADKPVPAPEIEQAACHFQKQ